MSIMIEMVRDERSYAVAMKRIDELMDMRGGEGPTPNSPELDELEIRVALAGAYEDKHFRIEDDVSAADAIRIFMSWQDYSQSDLGDVLQSRSRASEILNKRIKGLSRPQMQRIHDAWHIPAEFLIRDIAG